MKMNKIKLVLFAAFLGLTQVSYSNAYSDIQTLETLLVALNENKIEDIKNSNLTPEILNGMDENGLTPVHTAIRLQNLELVKILVEKGAELNIQGTQGYQATPLMYAASMPDPAILNYLIDNGAEINTPDVMGDPAINWASYYGFEKIVETLLERGSRTDQRGHGNALEIVMRRGFPGLEKTILAHQGNLKVLTSDEEKVINAIMAGDISIKSLLENIDLKTATTETHKPLLSYAAGLGHIQQVRDLIAAGADVNVKDIINFTPLFDAARGGHLDVVKTLIDTGAEVNQVSHKHGLELTALHMAAITDAPDVIETLVENGANMNAQGSQGGTPAMWASYEGKIASAVKLVELGTGLSVENMNGQNILDVAKLIGNKDLEEAILKVSGN